MSLFRKTWLRCDVKNYQWACLITIELILICLVISNFSTDLMLVFIGMQIVILINRMAYCIRDDLFFGADWVRRTLYFLPYILFFFMFGNDRSIDSSGNLYASVLIAIVLGLGFVLFKLKDLMTIFNKQYILFFAPITLSEALLQSYSLVGSAILQELFYRGFIFTTILLKEGPIQAIFFSSILFVSEHVLHQHAEKLFHWTDYMMQFLLSVLSCALYLYSGSVIVAILIHFMFNAPLAVNQFYRLWIHWKARRSFTYDQHHNGNL